MHVERSNEQRRVERVVCLRTRAEKEDAPYEILLVDDCAIAVYRDDRAERFPSLDLLLRAHRLDVADLEFEPR